MDQKRAASRRRSMRKRFAVFAVIGGLIGWLIVHSIIIVLHLLPSNAITVLHPDIVGRYVPPFFGQNWHLFAPNPPTVNRTFLIQLMVRPVSEERDQLTEWFDVTTLLQKSTWSNPLSLAVTRHRTIEGIVASHSKYVAREASDQNYISSPQDLNDIRIYNRLLSILAKELYSPEKYRLVAIRGRLVLEKIPPFSELESFDYTTPELKTMTFEWFPPDEQ